MGQVHDWTPHLQLVLLQRNFVDKKVVENVDKSILSKIKIRLQDSEVTVSDELLSDFIEEATEEVFAVTQQTALNRSLEKVVIASVVMKVHRLGTEGIASESYSGVSTSYLKDLPSTLQSVLYSNSRIGSWGDDDESS